MHLLLLACLFILGCGPSQPSDSIDASTDVPLDRTQDRSLNDTTAQADSRFLDTPRTDVTLGDTNPSDVVDASQDTACSNCALEVVVAPYVVEPQPIRPTDSFTVRLQVRAPSLVSAYLDWRGGRLTTFVNETASPGLQTLTAVVAWSVARARGLLSSASGTARETLTVDLDGTDRDPEVNVALGGCADALCDGQCVTCPRGATQKMCATTGAICIATACESGLVLCGAECSTPVPAYRDADGDGFGTGAQIDGCRGNGYAAQGGDCDDTSARFHPEPNDGGPDARDFNCDGMVERVYPTCSVDACAGPTTALACASLRINCWRNGRACGTADEYAAGCNFVNGSCVPNWTGPLFVTCQ